MKVLINPKTGRYYYYKGPGDYHCKEGIIKEGDINSGSPRVMSTLKKEFIVFDAKAIDYHQTIKRGPQWIMPKDLGYVLTRTGLSKDSVVLEAGSGSGSATAFFARFVKKVYSYDVVEDHVKIAKKNTDYLGLENVEFEVGSVIDKVEGHEPVDLVFLDMPDPQEVFKKDLSLLSSGSFIVCYLPSITQIQQLVIAQMEHERLYVEEIAEVSIRNWRVGERVARPEHRKEIDHTAFLVFVRKL